MPAELEWVEPGRHVGGCLERAFTLGRAPGVLWRPAQRCTPKPPLVLLGHGRLAYLGMSMGTRFGLPLAAELGDRLRCLVIGKFGLRQHAAMDPRLRQRQRLAHAAAAITAPVVFHGQWHDEVFPRDGQLELFDAIASPAKRLLRASGGHGETPVGAIRAWRSAVADQLGPVDRSAPAKAPA